MAISNLKNNSGVGNLSLQRTGQSGKNRQVKKPRESQQENPAQSGVKPASFQKNSQIPDPGDLMKSASGNPKNVSIKVTLNNFNQGSDDRVNEEVTARKEDNEISTVDSGFLKQNQTNKAAGGNRTGETGALENANKTTENDKVNKRAEKAQENRIDSLNAAAANSPKKVQPLSQDTQLGTVFDAKG